jgi:hypothetical protein
LYAIQVQSQEYGNNLLFTEFEEGIVLHKDGGRSSALLNYDPVDEKILFVDKDDKIMTLAYPEKIASVTIGGHRFVPGQNKVFYEEIKAGDNFLYVRWKFNLIAAGKSTGYGTYNRTSSGSGGMKSMRGVDSDYSNYDSDKAYETQVKNVFFLKEGNKYKKFTSSQALAKLFKGHESEIEAFADKNSINFKKLEDVKKIVEYCFGL